MVNNLARYNCEPLPTIVEKLLKLCSHCKLSKPTTELYYNNTRKDELAHVCKSCKKANIIIIEN